MALLSGVPGFGPLRRIGRFFHRNFPPLNFITIHYIYFVAVCLISSLIFWGASTPAREVSYTDSLFLVVSAMTLAGLNTVDLSTLNTFQQFLLFFLIIIGSAIFVSSFVVHVRKKAFERRFDYIANLRQRRADQARKGPISLARRFSRSLTRSDARGIFPGSVIRETKESRESSNEEPSKGAPDDSEIGGGDASATVTVQPNNENDEATPSGAARSGAQDIAKSSQALGAGQRAEAENSENPHDDDSADFAQSLSQLQTRTITYQSEHGDEIHVNGRSAENGDDGPPEHITFGPNTYFRTRPEQSPSRHNHRRFISMQGVGAQSNATIRRRPTNTSIAPSEVPPENALQAATQHLPFLTSGYVSRNSQFHHLSEEEREQLGGCEYRAIQLLSWLVPVYFVLWQLLGCLGIGAYVNNNKASVARKNGMNPWWVGSFNAVSAFNNSGMSLLDANMVAFQTSIYMLITMGLLILAGNTCYPIFLRLIVWSFFKVLPENERWEEFRKTLRFLLDHPRRCYTNMFPSQHTWWLLLAVICLNGIDWAAFEILNLGNTAITSLPAGIEVLAGLFQALAVRSGGFYVVSISSVRISLQVLYVVMMYISVYPVVITMRNSNVYEERSLGIYADDPGYAAYAASQQPKPSGGLLGKLRRTLTNQPSEQQTKSYFMRQQLRAQLAHDIWWIVLAVFLIMIIESSNFEKNPTVFSVFNVIFEVVSGYGCVGISVGLPDQAYSFCGAWHTLSKLILCAVMIRGRHRGLPVAIDKAVLLPGEGLAEAEEEDAAIRLERTQDIVETLFDPASEILISALPVCFCKGSAEATFDDFLSIAGFPAHTFPPHLFTTTTAPTSSSAP
ncbi:cation transport protein-domain-containing protein [Clohesyomyces aquaticus]|uniref:Potassium transport protein n=1 Tax=Clohesyomyces aquaticus TaxID=1231657 RepID=A0A1Y1ZZR9_9PLEO|nr:cation transport protein-domain-containing protein [Clohesyomyces aquaticus]